MMNRISLNTLWCIALGLFLAACSRPDDLARQDAAREGPDLTQPDIQLENAQRPYAAQLDQLSTQAEAGLRSSGVTLTPHFVNWLNQNGYGSFNFSRSDIMDDSYGGKASNNTPVNREPVIFIHGNSDKALGTTFGQTGWTSSINYFLGQGYTTAELYAITWGPADAGQASDQYHSREYLTRIRAFMEAVLAYTGASKIDVIGHSMGVTLCRKAIKGGWAYDAAAGGWYNLGPSLTSQVDAFVGIAGGNQGLANCYLSPTTPTCNDENGFYPGYLWYGWGPYGVSDLIVDLNQSTGYEGDYRFSIWSTADQVIGYSCLVYGVNTCRIPGQTGEKAYFSYPYGHFNLKDLTEDVQYRMVTVHTN